MKLRFYAINIPKGENTICFPLRVCIKKDNKINVLHKLRFYAIEQI